MSPRNKTASLSRSTTPVKSDWRSFQIRWATPGISDLETVTGLPLVKLNPPAKFDDKPYLSKFSLNPGEDLTAPKPMPTPSQLSDSKRKGFLESIVVSMYVPTSEQFGSQRDATRVVEKRQQKMTSHTKGVMCTELEQWVIVDINVGSPTGPAPAIHLWAFLQPAGIGQNTAYLAGDHSLAPDDYPRSGWAEYRIDPNTKNAISVEWDGGKSSEVPMRSTDWVCQKLASPRNGAGATWRFKLRVLVRNGKTSGDVDREKKFAKTKIPETDFEAGCWLKVWVRDPKAGFSKAPMDDESDAVVRSMDAQSQRWIQIETDGLYFAGCHGFLRSRILDGTKTRSEDDAPPAYVLLFSKEAMEDLIALDKLLKEKGAGPLQTASSACATAVAALLLGMGLRKVLEAWKGKGDPDPQVNEEKAQFLIELLESYQVANILAAYGADGFQNLSPSKATLSASAHKAEFQAILSHLYGQVFDFCLVDSPSHYKQYVEKRLANRQQALEARIRWTKAHSVGAADHAKKEGDDKRARQAEMAEQLKGMGLGLANTAKKLADKKKNKTPNKYLDAANMTLGPIYLVQGQNTWSFPKPFGAPLPIPAVPMVWRVDVGLKGSLSVLFKITPPPDGSSKWEFFVEFRGDGSLTFVVGIHALWSSMDKAMVDDTPKQGEMKDEFQRNKNALRDLRKSALDSPAEPKTEIVRFLHSLMKYASLDIAVNASLNAQAVAGCMFTLDIDTGEISHQWLNTDKQPIHAGAQVSVDAHLQVSILNFDYNLAGMPHLASANPEVLSLDFSGQVLGKTWKVEPKKIEWGAGRIEDQINRKEDSDFVVWGRPATFALQYAEMSKPPIAYELTRSQSTSDKPAASLPDSAAKATDSGSGGKSEVALQLTCQKTTSSPLTGFGGLDLSSKINVLGAGHDFGPLTPAGQLIHDILHGGNASVFLRGNYMGSMFRFSQSFYIPTPRVSSPLQVKWIGDPMQNGQLQLHFGLGYYEDTHIWVQLTDEHGKAIPSTLGDDWQCLRIHSPRKDSQGISGFVVPRLGIGAVQGHVGAKLSLVPDDLGKLS